MNPTKHHYHKYTGIGCANLNVTKSTEAVTKIGEK